MVRTVLFFVGVVALWCCQTRPVAGTPAAKPVTPTAATPKAPAPDGSRLVPRDILTRTFQIRPTGSKNSGTGFVIHIDGREYLVTAAHVVVGLKDRLEILWKRNWLGIGARVVGSAAPQADIAVLALERSIAKPAPFDLSAATSLSEQLFIVGFPYSFGTNLPRNVNAGYPVPFLKSGVLSGYLTDASDKTIGMYLDAINNPGFSGGPVVAAGWPTRIVGVVSGYEAAATQVMGPNNSVLKDPTGTPLGLHVNENTGLTSAYSIRFAIDLIHANSIGPTRETGRRDH